MHRAITLMVVVLLTAGCATTPAEQTVDATPDGTAEPTTMEAVTSTTLSSPQPTRTLNTTPSPTAMGTTASNLQAEPRCSETEPRQALADLSWQPASPAGSAQQVEVSIYRDGFTAGRAQRSPLLPAEQTLLTWDQVSPGTIHYWRVLTQHGAEWVPSEINTFEGPTCIADFVPVATP